MKVHCGVDKREEEEAKAEGGVEYRVLWLCVCGGPPPPSPPSPSALLRLDEALLLLAHGLHLRVGRVP